MKHTATGYGYLRQCTQAVDRASAHATDDVRRELDAALSALYTAEDALGRALAAQRAERPALHLAA